MVISDADSGTPRVRDYELLRVVGAGSFGEVWLARSMAGAFRAIKIISQNPSADDRTLEREFAGLKRFEPISHRHPGWVRILHVVKNDQEGFYYVMEAADDCIRGQEIVGEDYAPRTLSSELTRRGRLPLKECIALGVSLTTALEALHQHNLVHRDIKPSNVIYVNAEPKLADIGLVARIGEPRTSSPGTEGFAPPEGSGTALADIFSLGRLLYVAWTDMDACSFPELPDNLVEGSDAGPVQRFNRLILKACEFDPGRRFKSAQAMHDSLRELLVERRSTGLLRSAPDAGTAERPATTRTERLVAILCHSSGEADRRVSELLQAELAQHGYPVVLDNPTAVGTEWAWQTESNAPLADAVVMLLSTESVHSEMMAYELEMAREAGLRRGKPILIPIRIQFSESLPDPLARLLNGIRCLSWESPNEDQVVVREILNALANPADWRLVEPSVRFEPPWGAMPLSSTFYVVRPADHEFRAAIARRDSIVLVRGARQMGKSSLLARGLDEARSRGVLVVLTDFQSLSSSDFESLDRFYQALANSITDQLDLEVCAADKWDNRRSPNTNFDRFLRREVFEKLNAQIVWGLDEVDRLFTCTFGTEVFGMFRSWHNKRALDPDGHWANLSLAIAYATEAHLFISDLNQSPFNVGTPLTLEDFQKDQVADLNHRYGDPLKSEQQLSAFFGLVNGHPFLVRRGLHELATRAAPFDLFETQAARDEGIFGDHLRRMLVILAKDRSLLEVVRRALQGGSVDAESFYRLRGAGLMGGETASEARIRCPIYTEYLRRHLL
jgi:hypothetical protein